MLKKNKIIIAVCAVLVIAFGGLFAMNTDLLKGNSFSGKKPLSFESALNPTATLTPQRPIVTKDYCIELKKKVDLIEARGKSVTSTLSEREKSRLGACTQLIGTFVDNPFDKCRDLQIKINELVSRGIDVTSTLNTFEKNFTLTCNSFGIPSISINYSGREVVEEEEYSEEDESTEEEA
jgi:hypothetical protein